MIFGGLFDRNSEAQAELVDTLTSLDVEMGHYLDIAKELSKKIVLFEQIKDISAFKEICHTYADELMREYFDETKEDSDEESRLTRVKMRAMATSVNNLADEYDRLVQEKSQNQVRISQTKQAIEETRKQMEAIHNG